MGVEEYFNAMVKNRLWDGRIVGMPAFFAFVSYSDDGIKSQEVGKFINDTLVFMNN